MKRTVADFLSSFVLPLVAGGELKVGRPISEPEIEVFSRNLADASVESVAIDDARERVLSEIVVGYPNIVFEADDLYLAASLHNLLFLVHPDADAWMVTRGVERRVVDTARSFARRPMTRNRRRVLARHGLLHNLFSLSREDVTLRWWTGRARFVGQAPPQRLMRWRSVRRVIEERGQADYRDLFGHEGSVPIVFAALRRSPLTLLLSPTHLGASLRWEDLAFLLRDPELARAAAYRATASAEPLRAVASAAAYAAGFEQMLERRPPAEDVRAVAAFLVHIAALLALAEATGRDERHSTMLNAVLGADGGGLRPKGLATFLALPNALERVDARLGRPPDLDADVWLSRRWNQHRAQVAERLGGAFVDALVTRLERHLSATAVEPGAEPAVSPS